ncbi:MAG TPA: hypothetical protein VGR28_14545 [Candidatus Thermoplasmatota archaeon]|jgi:hypothetical protein|nr:hypothetical protein [Candidatus Thermoplasmatota archaeon]
MALSTIEVLLRLAVAALSLLAFAVGAVAFARRPTGRVLLMLGLFSVFLVQGVLLLLDVVVEDSPLPEDAYFAFQFLEVLLVTAVFVKR